MKLVASITCFSAAWRLTPSLFYCHPTFCVQICALSTIFRRTVSSRYLTFAQLAYEQVREPKRLLICLPDDNSWQFCST